MARNSQGSRPSAATDDPRNTLRISGDPNKSRDQLLTEFGFSSIGPNATTTRTYAKGIVGQLDLTDSVEMMTQKVAAVQRGDLSGLEATLAAQAVTLDAIFNEMARRAALNMGEYITATDIYMRMALKAQAQCRATIETLAEIKNPKPVAFVRQANIAAGPQQVNNGVAAPLPPTVDACAGTSAEQANEQLGLSHEQRLDAGTPRAAIGAGADLETVGAIQRANV